MGLFEYIVFDCVTCCVCCVIVYFINDMKSYDKIQLIPNEDKSDKSENLYNENIRLLQPIKEQPYSFIILKNNL